MEFRRLCENHKGQLAAALGAAESPSHRADILVHALYAFSTELLPLLGRPGRSEEYLRRQEAALDLVSFLGLALVKCGDRRGTAVLVEVGEGCVDPLLKKKFEVYAQELLAKSAPAPAVAPVRRPLLLAILVCTLVLLSAGAFWVRHQGRPIPKSHAEEWAAPDTVFEPPALPLLPKAGRPVGREARVESEPELPEVHAPGADPAPPAARTTKVRVVNDQILVPVTLKSGAESIAVDLVLDTGATRTAVFDTVAARLKLDLHTARAARSELADGRVIPSAIVRIDAINVGPFSHAGFDVEVFPYSGGETPHLGLLGMDFLGKHRYQLDLENGLIHWL
ncbi:retropepsin-like aspartic protease family protein [Geomesophilobacter sediminis]|uniref:Clan AA aspartic protease n=1 Tax=Geomesophilobacter sediminis TaxID=2798584 RepID=A0A8J7LZ99_9BACT|nr:retropepsin-like aspartic protease [Geomesophilobacter sediminis]MBJ6726046.1 clan AA aspartic protease [Geomesophilobacter sediminis]